MSEIRIMTADIRLLWLHHEECRKGWDVAFKCKSKHEQSPDGWREEDSDRSQSGWSSFWSRCRSSYFSVLWLLWLALNMKVIKRREEQLVTIPMLGTTDIKQSDGERLSCDRHTRWSFLHSVQEMRHVVCPESHQALGLNEWVYHRNEKRR